MRKKYTHTTITAKQTVSRFARNRRHPADEYTTENSTKEKRRSKIQVFQTTLSRKSITALWIDKFKYFIATSE